MGVISVSLGTCLQIPAEPQKKSYLDNDYSNFLENFMASHAANPKKYMEILCLVSRANLSANCYVVYGCSANNITYRYHNCEKFV